MLQQRRGNVIRDEHYNARSFSPTASPDAAELLDGEHCGGCLDYPVPEVRKSLPKSDADGFASQIDSGLTLVLLRRLSDLRGGLQRLSPVAEAQTSSRAQRRERRISRELLRPG